MTPTDLISTIQLPEGEGDPVPPFREALGEAADVDRGALRQRQDVGGQPDGGQRQLSVLGEVVADDRVPVGLVRPYVGDTGVGGGLPKLPLRAHDSVRLLLSHGEGLDFLVGQALALGLQSRRGPMHVWGCDGAWGETARPSGHRATRTPRFHPRG